MFVFFFKQKTAYEMRISDWSSDVCSSDLDIVRRALQSPLRQIAENAGWDGAVVAGKLIDGHDETLGFNAQTEVYENLVQAGVIDPTKVVRDALPAAASVAGLLIPPQAAVSDLPEDTPAIPRGGGGTG